MPPPGRIRGVGGVVMAGKVNTRFVVLLGAGLAAVCGLLALAVFTLVLNSGEDHVRNGDKAMAAGEFGKAKLFYGKAVSDDPTRVDWLEKWLEAIQSITPETETAYRDSFTSDYVPALMQIAAVEQTDIEAHRRVLEVTLQQLRQMGFERALADRLVDQTTDAAAFFDRDPNADPKWRSLLRYRGIAREAILGNQSVISAAEIELIGEDLRAALEVDPGDSDAMVSLLRWIVVSETQGVPTDVPEPFEAARAKAIAEADAFLERNPGDVGVMAMRALLRFDSVRVQAGYAAEEAERVERVIAALSGLEPELAELESAILASDPSGLSQVVLDRFRSLERYISPGTRLGRTRDMLNVLMDRSPEDLDLRWFAADTDRQAGDLESAAERFASMADLPKLPVSLEGWVRFDRMRRAWFNQAMIELELGSGPEGDGDRLVKAVALRDRLRGSVSEDNVQVLLLDGRIAEAEGKRNEALRLYRRFNERTLNDRAEGLRYEARMAMLLGQTGTARQALERLLGLNDSDLQAMLMLADIRLRLQDTRGASELYRRALIQDSDNQFALDGLRRIELFENPVASEDPVIALVMRSRQMRLGSEGTPANPAGAAELLADGMESVNYDPRAASELMSSRLDQGDIEGARAVGQESLRRHPDDDRMASLLSALEGDSRVEVLERMIETSDRTQAQKLIDLASLYFSRGLTEKLDPVLAELEGVAPENPTAVEMGFVRALQKYEAEKQNKSEIREDEGEDEGESVHLVRARDIADRAASLNLDFANGLTYRARIADAEDKMDESIALLQQARAMGTADALVYGLLGGQLRATGQTDAAIAAYEQALAIRPDDLQTITDLVSTIAEVGRFEQALDVARRQQRFGRSSPQFVQLWLTLEALAGGNEGRALAITQREQMLAANPADVENRYALARLYIADKNWTGAKTLIDAMMSEESSLRATELLAQWYADQGRVGSQDGLLLADQAYQRYIRGLGDDVSSRPFISLARFMIDRGRPDLAIRAADQAISLESPETLEGTKLKGELLMFMGQPEGAAAAFKKVIDAGLDGEDGQYRARVIDMYLGTNQYAAAQEAISGMPASTVGTLRNLLQRASIAAGLGDTAGERRLLDEAASKFPDNAFVYIKRAQSMLGNAALLPDLLSDIEAALKRSPNDWRALRVRAAALFDADRRSEAMRDLRAVLRANPSLDDALFSVMNELLNDNRLGEAMDAAREVLDARPNDAPLMYQLGKLFESRGDWKESAEMFERAWEARRSSADGASLIDAALRMNPPDVATANAVINDLASTVEGGIEKSPGLLAAQSLVLRARGREDFAVQQMTKAFDLSVNDEFQIQTWSQNAARFYLDLDAENEMAYYRSLRARFTDPATRAWIDVFTAQRQLVRDFSEAEALSTLRRLTQEAAAPQSVRVIAFRALGNEAFEREDFEGAVAAWSAGLEVVPDNWELNNNAAYTLSMELGRHEEALELAERAIAAGPARSEPYDTLAEVYIKLGRFDEAEQMILLGEERARTYSARVTLSITRARMAVAKGDNEGARVLLRNARSLLRTVAGRDARLEAEIDKVEAGIGSDG